METLDGMRCLEIDGEFSLDTVGVVAAATTPLAAADVSVFVVSVWDRDFILINGSDLDRAIIALRNAGHDASHDLF